MQPKSRRAAWWQAIALVAVTATIATATTVRLHRPFDADTLAIQVGELHSVAAETQLLVEQAGHDHLAPAFVRHHAQQLRTTVERTRDALAGKAAIARYDAQRRQALALADALHARLDVLARDAASASATPQAFAALADALDALDHRIKPDA
ncbi:hypothetical protein [Lysobacter sp. TY2-98]|uniref:hypothetical protein n=1 Tax=Lysobacter sp. TY2-98 TaxID=2290922 RepID=UPI0013B3BCB7|nr:hypothetical protein [Lysobacter sp. TY2-98]